MHFACILGLNPVNEFRRLFRGYSSTRVQLRGRMHPYARSQPAPRQRLWIHNFYCLGDKDAVTVPGSKFLKKSLSDVGLWEKRLEIPTEVDANALHEVLIEAFPQLSVCGGYQLLKCIPNSINLQLLSSA